MYPSIFLSNVRSVFHKFDELFAVVQNLKPCIVSITESWLNPLIPSSILDLPGYCIFRCDRTLRKGGGVCTWIRSELAPSVVSCTATAPPEIEVTWCTIFRPNMLVCSVYIPPPGLSASVHTKISDFFIQSTDDLLTYFLFFRL